MNRVVSQTEQPLHTVEAWFARYGTGAAAIAAYAAEGNDRPLDNLPTYTEREVRYIVTHEQVVTLTDFVLRRSLIAMLGKLTPKLLEELANIIGDELGWSADEQAAQVAATEQHLLENNLAVLTDNGSHLVEAAPAEEAAEADAAPVAGD
jgi:glycerol-3-phosphate dehydrogenase